LAVKTWPGLFSEYGLLVTTNLVVAETFTFLRYQLGTDAALEFLNRTDHTSRLEIVYADARLETAAKTLLNNFRDQSFSYTDAVSFAVMDRLELKDAFAFDKHFRVVGFNIRP
jgi:uncharacterized protein